MGKRETQNAYLRIIVKHMNKIDYVDVQIKYTE